MVSSTLSHALQVVAILLFASFAFNDVLVEGSMSTEEIHSLREAAREMFYHGYNNYMEHGFPHDEVRPVSCRGRWRGCERNRGALDDTLGNYSLTLVDTLDSLAVIGDKKEFQHAIDLIEEHVSFDRDIKVSLFEVTIRMLGGLLSGHTLASDPELDLYPEYNGNLLRLARDLGDRLLPAFKTPTGIPYARVNLKTGVAPNEDKDTCTAGAGTLIIEFGVLSRLTGDRRYEDAARHALLQLWARKSPINLVGHVINVENGRWVRAESGIGAGMDSFFEYLLKAHVLFGDKLYLDIFNEAYDAVMKHVKHGPWYRYVDMHKGSGTHQRPWIDSLQAFWPGLQVMKGDVEEAARTHTAFYTIWRRFGLIVEGFNVESKTVHSPEPGYPLRPELVESTYLLYEATKRSHFMQVGKEMLQSINTNARVQCGYAVVHNVPIRTHEDRMDSFFLSETVKYLYLLFDTDNFVNKGNYVFSTEGHIFKVTRDLHTARRLSDPESRPWASDYHHQCLVTPSTIHNVFDGTELRYYEDACGIGQNHGVVPVISGLHDTCTDPAFSNKGPDGKAPRKPSSDTQSGAKVPLAVTLPDSAHLYVVDPARDNHVDDVIQGTVEIDLAETPVAYVLSKVNGQDVKTKSLVIFGWPPPPPPPPPPPGTPAPPPPAPPSADEGEEGSDGVDGDDGGQCMWVAESTVVAPGLGLAAPAVLALFGPTLPIGTGVNGNFVLADPLHGCHTLQNPELAKGNILVVERGQCLFLDKARAAEEAGAKALIVITRQNGLFAMGGMPDEIRNSDVKIPCVMTSHVDGAKLEKAIAEYHTKLKSFTPGGKLPFKAAGAPAPVSGAIVPGLTNNAKRPVELQTGSPATMRMHSVKLVLQGRIVTNVDVVQSDLPKDTEMCVLHGKEHAAHLAAIEAAVVSEARKADGSGSAEQQTGAKEDL